MNGRPGYFFDLSVRNTLQPAFLIRGALRAGVAADAGLQAKDAHHLEAVEESGGDLHPLAVETFGVWAAPSLDILHQVASRAATFSGLPIHRAFRNLLQQLSVTLWQFNARLLRHRLVLAEDVAGWDLPG